MDEAHLSSNSAANGLPGQTSSPTCTPVPARFGSAPAVLHEIRHALARLIETGEPTCIDLAALPFGPGDQEQLLDALGSGEVRASIDALGETRIQETRYSGVWLVDYYNTEGERIGLQIEVATVPRLLQAQPEGLPAALDALAARLATMPSADPASPPVSHPEGNPFSNPSVAGSKHHG